MHFSLVILLIYCPILFHISPVSPFPCNIPSRFITNIQFDFISIFLTCYLLRSVKYSLVKDLGAAMACEGCQFISKSQQVTTERHLFPNCFLGTMARVAYWKCILNLKQMF